jgi:hypothetical protein
MRVVELPSLYSVETEREQSASPAKTIEKMVGAIGFEPMTSTV